MILQKHTTCTAARTAHGGRAAGTHAPSGRGLLWLLCLLCLLGLLGLLWLLRSWRRPAVRVACEAGARVHAAIVVDRQRRRAQRLGCPLATAAAGHAPILLAAAAAACGSARATQAASGGHGWAQAVAAPPARAARVAQDGLLRGAAPPLRGVCRQASNGRAGGRAGRATHASDSRKLQGGGGTCSTHRQLSSVDTATPLPSGDTHP
jgi:hypothetical protein